MAFLDDLYKSLTSQTGLGAAALLGGTLLDKEPGEVLQARQALRNNFTNPYSAVALPSANTAEGFLTNQVTSPDDPFAAGGVYERYKPILAREEGDVLSGLQTTLSKAFPANVGVVHQGPVQENLRRATEQFAINREGLVADLLREQQTRQQQAANSLLDYGQGALEFQRGSARDILNTSKPDPTASAIANLGAMLLANQGSGTGTGGFNLSSLLGGGQATGTGGGSALQAILQQVLRTGSSLGTNALGGVQGLLSSIFGGGGGAAAGTDLLTQSAQFGGANGLAGTSGLTFSGGAAGAGGGAASGLMGALTSPAALAIAAAAAAYGGYKLGEKNEGWADVPGWAKAGLILGTGGLAAFPFLGADKGQKAQKAQFRTDDLASQLDQVYEIGNVGAGFLAEAGVDQNVMSAWQAYVDEKARTYESPADEQGQVASELNRVLTTAGFPPGQRPAGWRQKWIDSLMASTFTSGNSSFGGGAPRDLIEGPWLSAAQL